MTLCLLKVDHDFSLKLLGTSTSLADLRKCICRKITIILYNSSSDYQDMADASKKRAAPAGGAEKSNKKSKVNLCISHYHLSEIDRA